MKENPDQWVRRADKLVPITGEFPYNAEAEISDNFITPNSQCYVRNHGAVPKLDWNKFKVSFQGLLDTPKSFGMDELISGFQSQTLVVTFACDGFRRKELNIVKQTKGSNFTTGVIQTAEYKGVLLADVLQVLQIQTGSKYVWFGGCDELQHGSYETSVLLDHVLDKDNKVMLAYEMNGQRLPPDHGYPLRVIVPGYVGGRNVKWLSRVVVSDVESDNFYHTHDNMVLPPSVLTEEQAKPYYSNASDYILYEHNIQSVITKPRHGDVLKVGSIDECFKLSGFAFSGGGRRIRRVGLSMDNGSSWQICEQVKHPLANRFSWIFWECDVPVWKLLRCNEIVVRAFDAALNTQPERPIWNIHGMMNNSWYRVRCQLAENNDGPTLHFKHPVLPGLQKGGFMDEEGSLSEVLLESQNSIPSQEFSWHDIQKHNKPDDLWIVIDKKVYDVSKFDHPAGLAPIMICAGNDATKEFYSLHSIDAMKLKEEYAVGRLQEHGQSIKHGHVAPNGKTVALSNRSWTKVKLVKKDQLTHDTFKFVFAFQDRNSVCWIPTGYHVQLGGFIHQSEPDEVVSRPYTPTSPVMLDEEDGTVEFTIKIYYPHQGRPGGELTSYLDKLCIGDEMEVKGPEGLIHYEGHGMFLVGGKYIYAECLTMIAGGTGITPLLQVCHKIAHLDGDKTKVRLLCSNKTKSDIMCQDRLEQLQKKMYLQVTHTLTEEYDDNWNGCRGHLNLDMAKKYLFEPNDRTLALLCGPPALIDKGCLPLLREYGYDDDQVLVF